MAGKFNVFNLGDLGVHLTESPVHSPDGSFTSAQNASVSENQGEHGIRKRLGLSKLTSDALNGSVLALGNMPFPDPFAALAITGTRLYAGIYTEGPTSSYRTTTNGTTWATASPAPSGDWESAAFNLRFTQRGGVISGNGLITYYKESSGGGLATFNGTTTTQIVSGFTLGSFAPQGGPCLHQGLPVIALKDATSGKLLRRNGSSFETLTSSIGKPPIGVASILNRVYIGTDENRIYYWSDDGGLVLDITISATGGAVSITDIVHENGIVYASCCSKVGGTTATTHKVLKRTADASWTDITPHAQGDYGPMAAFGGDLYVVRQAHDAFAGCEIRKYDGSSWTTDLDVTTLSTGATSASAMVVWNGALYATVQNSSTRDIIRRSGGTWTRVHTESGGASRLFPTLGFY